MMTVVMSKKSKAERFAIENVNHLHVDECKNYNEELNLGKKGQVFVLFTEDDVLLFPCNQYALLKIEG